MDMITLAMAKAYTDSKQLASKKETKRLVCDFVLDAGRNWTAVFTGNFNADYLKVGKTYLLMLDGMECKGTATEGANGAFGVGKNGDALWWDVESDLFAINISVAEASNVARNGSLYWIEEEIVHIDPKYLPPLTSPSGKQFKLTVDDSGTITATEVV